MSAFATVKIFRFNIKDSFLWSLIFHKRNRPRPNKPIVFMNPYRARESEYLETFLSFSVISSSFGREADCHNR